MTTPAIEVEGVWKEYAIGRAQGADENLREMIYRVASTPFRRHRKANDAADQKIWALRDVSLRVDQGEAIGIVGRNGAGKSTLLKILSRITEPTRGRAVLRGRASSLLQVGTGFHPDLTGRENVFLNGAILGMSRQEIRRKFDAIVAFAEVEKFIDTPVKHYSSGMHVRLGFAVSAHLEPEILIVDEALSVGDAGFQKKSLQKMGELSANGRTVIFVSHGLQAVRNLCSRALILQAGGIVYNGEVEEGLNIYMEGLPKTRPETLLDVDTRAFEGRPVNCAAAAAIERVRLLPAQLGEAIHSGESFALELDLAVKQPCANILVGWTLNTAEGVCALECRTLDSYRPIEQLRPGQYRLRCDVEALPLRAGQYVMNVGMRDTAGKLFDYVHEVLTVRVEPSRHVHTSWSLRARGLLQLPSRWQRPESL